MPERPSQAARSAALPIWVIVVVALLLSSGSAALIAQSTTRIGRDLGRLQHIRTAASAYGTDHARFTDSANSILRTAFSKGGSDSRHDPFGDVTPPNTTELRAVIESSAFDTVAVELDSSCAMVQDLARRTVRWHGEADRVADARDARLAAFCSSALALRNGLEELRGRQRLAAVRSAGSEAAVIPIARIDSALIDLIDLIFHVERLELATDTDALHDFAGNWMTPTLDRMTDALDDVTEAFPDSARLGRTLTDIRASLSDHDGQAPDDAGASLPGVLETIADRIRLRAQGAELEQRASAALEVNRALTEELRTLIDQAAATLRAHEASAVNSSLLKSIFATGFGAIVLLLTGRRLACRSRRDALQFHQTLDDLNKSRAQLVDIRELRAAHDRTERANTELNFQKRALDLANIVSECDPDGRITYVNDAFCELCGYPREALLNNNHRILESRTHSREFWEGMYTALRRDGFWQGNICNRAKDGSFYWVRSTVVAFCKADGTLHRLVSIGTDITEQRKAIQASAESAAFARATVDALTAHIAILDGDGRIIGTNRAWARFCNQNGGRAEDTCGASYLAACEADGHGQGRAAAAGLREVLAGTRTDFSMEYACHAPDQKRWFMLRATRFQGDGPVRVVVAHEDITAVRQAQEALKEQAAELELARHAAEQASRAKSEFLAAMSHEIRTPLNGIVGTLDLLQSSRLTEQQRRYIQIGKTSAVALTSVINDILDFSKIEAGKLDLCPADFDLRSTVEDVMEMLAIKASEKRLELACRISAELPRCVRGDPDRLRQIIVNLVTNAVKFTDTGLVTLSVVPAAEPGRVRFTVVDTGIGIPADRIARLFKAFSQADASTTRKYGGTGLGLAISKRLAELMDGSIGVESTPGQGSTFWFEVILPAAPSCPPDAAQPPALSFKGVRALILDDSDIQLTYTAEVLRSLQLDVNTTSRGDHALELLRSAADAGHPFDLVLTDHLMPDMDGFEFAAIVQSSTSLCQTRIILLSSVVDLDPAAALAAGFAASLAKPLRYTTLLDAIASALRPASAPLIDTPHHPLATRRAAAAVPTTPSTHPARRILLVEDNEINQIIAREALISAGFACAVAANGTAAIEAVRGAPFDLVLMDCQMPGMDGFEATAEIRRLEQAGRLTTQSTPRLPIIALTANALSGDRERCLQAGMDGYCSKPIDLRELLETIAKLSPAGPIVPATQESRS